MLKTDIGIFIHIIDKNEYKLKLSLMWNKAE